MGLKVEYAITPHQNHYDVGDKIQFDLLEWGNYQDCWDLELKIIDTKTYLRLSEQLVEISKMANGWISYISKTQKGA